MSVCAPWSVRAGNYGLFTIATHSASSDGLFANSYLIVGEETATLIDAHLNVKDAAIVRDLIHASGKPLENIVITHPHPDHFEGLQLLGPAFPDTVISSAQRSVDLIRQTAVHWAGFTSKFAPMNSGTHVLSGVSTECLLMADAESISPIVLYIPEEKLLISGDHALNGQHLWLAEMRAEAWTDNLRQIEERWEIGTVLPGHGTSGDTEILKRSARYIEDFLDVVRTNTDRTKARREMIGRHPQLRFEAALDASLLAYMG